ncbi:Gustatory receptor 135 [Halyomorpha halys]|nr:Gustatory receptor 135 [Halyomorpha halys]
MVRSAWEVRSNIVDDAFEQILKIPRLLGLFPFFNDQSFSLFYFIVSLTFSVCTGLKIVLINWNQIVNVTRSFFYIFTTIVTFNIIALLIVNVTWPLIKFKQLEIIRKKLKELSCIIKKSIDLQYELKWYELNWSCAVMVCICLYRSYPMPEDIYFFFIYCRLELAVLGILNQTYGFLVLIGVLMSKIKYIRCSHVQVELVTDVMVVFQLINDYFGVHLFLITLGVFLRNVDTVYLLLKYGWDMDRCVSFMIMITTFAQFGLLIKSATQIKNKMAEINQCFFEKLIINPNDEILTFYLLTKKEFTFNACGLFNFDGKFMKAMLAGSITYIVIVFQNK